jgi:hypothetical protein
VNVEDQTRSCRGGCQGGLGYVPRCSRGTDEENGAVGVERNRLGVVATDTDDDAGKSGGSRGIGVPMQGVEVGGGYAEGEGGDETFVRCRRRPADLALAPSSGDAEPCPTGGRSEAMEGARDGPHRVVWGLSPREYQARGSMGCEAMRPGEGQGESDRGSGGQECDEGVGGSSPIDVSEAREGALRVVDDEEGRGIARKEGDGARRFPWIGREPHRPQPVVVRLEGQEAENGRASRSRGSRDDEGTGPWVPCDIGLEALGGEVRPSQPHRVNGGPFAFVGGTRIGRNDRRRAHPFTKVGGKGIEPEGGGGRDLPPPRARAVRHVLSGANRIIVLAPLPHPRRRDGTGQGYLDGGSHRTRDDDGATGGVEWKGRGFWRADKVAWLRVGSDPERDGGSDVGADVRCDGSRGSLGSQDEVKAEGATLGREPCEIGDELPIVGDEFLVLVRDDQEPRRCPARPFPFVERPVACLGERPFAILDFAGEGLESASGEMGIEIGEDAAHVREANARPNPGSALEIDEGHREVGGRVAVRESEDEGLQEPGLPRARRPRDEDVRSVSIQVEGEGTASRHAEWGRESSGSRHR